MERTCLYHAVLFLFRKEFYYSRRIAEESKVGLPAPHEMISDPLKSLTLVDERGCLRLDVGVSIAVGGAMSGVGRGGGERAVPARENYSWRAAPSLCYRFEQIVNTFPLRFLSCLCLVQGRELHPPWNCWVRPSLN